MTPQTVTIFRSGGKVSSDEDEQRLGVELNEANRYQATFTGTMIEIYSDFAWVVKDNGKLVKVKIGEITNVDIV